MITNNELFLLHKIYFFRNVKIINTQHTLPIKLTLIIKSFLLLIVVIMSFNFGIILCYDTLVEEMSHLTKQMLNQIFIFMQQKPEQVDFTT